MQTKEQRDAELDVTQARIAHATGMAHALLSGAEQLVNARRDMLAKHSLTAEQLRCRAVTNGVATMGVTLRHEADVAERSFSSTRATEARTAAPVVETDCGCSGISSSLSARAGAGSRHQT